MKNKNLSYKEQLDIACEISFLTGELETIDDLINQLDIKRKKNIKKYLALKKKLY